MAHALACRSDTRAAARLVRAPALHAERARRTSQFCAEQTGKRLKDLTRRIHAALKQPDLEAVHALRISIRRMQPVLDVFQPCFDVKCVKKIRQRLKKVLALAGQVRNYDVALKLLPKNRGRGTAALRTKLHTQREDAANRLRAALETESVEKLTVVHPDLKFGRQPAHTTARRELVRLAADLFESGDQAAASSHTSARRLHQLRIAAKQFHYTLELFASLYGRPARGMILKIQDVQSLLGAVSNHRAARDTVAGLGGERRIEEQLKKEQHKRMKRFRRIWKEQFPHSVVKQWMRALRKTSV